MDVTVGVHKGSTLSPSLIVLTMDCIVNHLEKGPLRPILYADVIALHSSRQPGGAGREGTTVASCLCRQGLRLNVMNKKFISTDWEKRRGR